MRRREIFFVCLFAVTFLLCSTTIAGDYLCKRVEKLRFKNEEQQVEQQVEQKAELQVEEMNEIIDGEMPDREVAEVLLMDEEEDKGNSQERTENVVKEIPLENFTEQLLEEEPVAEAVGYEYFADALFIGDSRTVGLMEYGNIENATFFADSGMSVFDLEKKKVSIPDEGKVSFDELLNEREYGKIYLMLGINELGYRFENIQKKYEETVEKIKESQGNAIIYLCANMHVTEEQSQKDEIYNNANVNKVNEMICGLADNETVFYIDVNELFDDENGSLSTNYSSDSFHVYGKYYMDWVDWLCTKTIKKSKIN